MIFIILLLSSLAILSCWKWYKWKFTANTTILFLLDKYHECADEETFCYTEMVIKKILGID